MREAPAPTLLRGLAGRVVRTRAAPGGVWVCGARAQLGGAPVRCPRRRRAGGCAGPAAWAAADPRSEAPPGRRGGAGADGLGGCGAPGAPRAEGRRCRPPPLSDRGRTRSSPAASSGVGSPSATVDPASFTTSGMS